MIDFIIDNILYISIALLIILIIFGVIFLKPKKKVITPSLDTSKLLEALGGKPNIVALSIEHQRLKINVKDLKMIQQSLLKELSIPAFLKGKELTLLIKHNAKEVMSFLSE